MKIKGTRVDYGTQGAPAKDSKSGSLKQSSSVSGQTNAKIPIDGVSNEAREKNSPAQPATRKTTGS